MNVTFMENMFKKFLLLIIALIQVFTKPVKLPSTAMLRDSTQLNRCFHAFLFLVININSKKRNVNNV